MSGWDEVVRAWLRDVRRRSVAAPVVVGVLGVAVSGFWVVGVVVCS